MPTPRPILVVTWTQLKAADRRLLEFSFSGSRVMTSRALAGATGSHRDVVLGVPEKTAVTVRIVSKLGGVDYKTKDYQGTTGALPSGLPKPTFVSYDATLASPALAVRRCRGFDRRHASISCLLLQRPHLDLDHGSPGPHRLVLGGSLQQLSHRRIRASRATASTS